MEHLKRKQLLQVMWLLKGLKMFGNQKLIKELKIVQAKLDNVYLINDEMLNRVKELQGDVFYIRNLLDKIVGSTEEITRRNNDFQTYQKKLTDAIGNIVDGLPEPPAGLTGRGRS